MGRGCHAFRGTARRVPPPEGVPRDPSLPYHDPMHAGPKPFEELERESRRIVGMICSETVREDEIQTAIAALRRRTGAEFPERPQLFDEIFGRRFNRLRTRFRPGAALFAPSSPLSTPLSLGD